MYFRLACAISIFSASGLAQETVAPQAPPRPAPGQPDAATTPAPPAGAPAPATTTAATTAVSPGQPAARPDSPSGKPVRYGPAGLPRDEFALGVALVAGPRFPGATKYRFLVVPYARYENGNGLYISPMEGIGMKTQLSKALTLGTSIRYDFNSRDSDDDPRFASWESVSGAAAATFFAEYRMGRTLLRAEIEERLAASDSNGGTAELQVAQILSMTPSGVVTAGAFVQGMNGDYANTFFSVSPTAAASSGLSEYNAGTGWYKTGVFVRYVAPIYENWGLFTRVAVEHLADEASDSPITDTDWQATVILGLAYRF